MNCKYLIFVAFAIYTLCCCKEKSIPQGITAIKSYPSSQENYDCDQKHPDYDALMSFYEAMNGDNWNFRVVSGDTLFVNTGWKDGVKGIHCNPCKYNTNGGFPYGKWSGIRCRNNRVVTIYLINSGLKGELPSDFGDLEFLETIELADNEIEGGFPDSFFELSNLRRIYMNGNKLKTEIPNDFYKLEKLEELYLADNELYGHLPENLVHSEIVTDLNLSINNIEGKIPDSYGNFENIETLRLHRNKLEGCIPNSFRKYCHKFKGDSNISFSNINMPWKGYYYKFCKNEIQIGAPCGGGMGKENIGTINNDCRCIIDHE